MLDIDWTDRTKSWPERVEAYLARHPYHPIKGEIESWLNDTRQLLADGQVLVRHQAEVSAIAAKALSYLPDFRGYAPQTADEIIMLAQRNATGLDNKPWFPRGKDNAPD